MYPRNAAGPERIAIGPVVQIADGVVQTSGCAVKIIPFGGTEAAGGGTVAYTADGVVLYTPTQAETNYTSFVLVASKAACIPANVTVVTTAEATAGTVRIGSIAADAITAASIATDAIGSAELAASAVTKIQASLATSAAIAALNNLSSAQVTAAVPSAATIAATTEAAMLNEGDASALLAAIAAKIETFLINDGDATATMAAIATAVRTNLATELGRIDTTISSRNATPPDNTGIAAIKAKTDNLPAAPAATGDVTTVGTAVAAVSAKLGTPVASVSVDIAAIKADTASLLGRVTATVATMWAALVEMISGTTPNRQFTATALALSPASVGAGTGARTVTITVNDGTTAIQSAIVRLTKGAETYTAQTNVSGVAVFNVDDGTWIVAITRPLYSYAGTTIVVTGSVSQTYSMSAQSITPGIAGTTTGYLTTRDTDFASQAGISVHCQLTRLPDNNTGAAPDDAIRTHVSDSNGLVTFAMGLGCTYRIWRDDSKSKAVSVTIAASAGTTTALKSLIG